MTRITIIGCGNMGTAILDGIRREYRVSVCEADSRRRNRIKRKYRVKTGPLEKLVPEADIVILAVKPQGFAGLLPLLKDHLRTSQLVVSIAAGITTQYIEKNLGSRARVVRVMPNLPVQVKDGMTVICKGKRATRNDLKKAGRIFDCIGETVVVQEKLMDAATAVSGSGPAYVFLFIEVLHKAARSLGLNEHLSQALVLQTLHGSLNLFEEKKESASILRGRVTSKGGTTEAAMKIFQKKKLEKIFQEALKAAKKRSGELSK